MLASLIVPVYSALPHVLKLCNSLIANPQDKLLDVVLNDDCSPDFDLREIIHSPFKVFRNEKNLGFVANVNAGAKNADPKSELLFFMNSDIEVRPNWLDPAVELFEKNDKVGVVGIKLVFPNNDKGEETIQSAGGWYDINRAPFHQYLGWLSSDRRVNDVAKRSWVTGAAFLTRRDLFEKIGGFDENYGRGYYEEVDYCEKAKELGYEVWYQPKCVAVHYVGQSMGQKEKTPEQTYAAAKSFRLNAIRFHSKWDSKIVPDVGFASGSL